MTNFDSLWSFDGFTPNPTQDSDLLQQMGFIPGLKDLLTLRQVHALEHATVWVLSENKSSSRNETPRPFDDEMLGGLSTEKGFYVYGPVNHLELQRAVKEALRRLKQGEWDLAVHPRCSTNLSVMMVLTGGFFLGMNLFWPKDPIAQLIGLGLAVSAANHIAPDLGGTTQKYLTTAIPFNLNIVEISQTKDLWGHSAYFVKVCWQDSQ